MKDGGCYVIVKRKIEIGDLTLESEEEFHIKLKKADPSKEHTPYTGTKKDLLYMRAILMCAQIELMFSWQDYNRGRDEKLPWKME